MNEKIVGGVAAGQIFDVGVGVASGVAGETFSVDQTGIDARGGAREGSGGSG